MLGDRRRTDCDLPYLPADKVELAVVEEWQTATFSDLLTEGVRRTVHEEFDQMLERDRLVVGEQKKRLVRLGRRREKLLDGYEEGIIAKADLVVRQERVDRELRDARLLIAKASRTHRTCAATSPSCCGS